MCGNRIPGEKRKCGKKGKEKENEKNGKRKEEKERKTENGKWKTEKGKIKWVEIEFPVKNR